MATLTINGQQVTVDDSFLQLSPEQQEDTVEEIAASLGSAQQPQSDYGQSNFAQATSGFNEGLANLLGAPVDLANTAIGAGMSGINALFGTDLQPSQEPWGGSAGLKRSMADMGAIYPETYSAGQQALRTGSRVVGSNILPLAGQAARAANPLLTAAVGGAGTAGGAGGAAAANYIAPDNPYAEMAGELLGTAALGVPAGMIAQRSSQRAAERAVPTIDELKSQASDLYAQAEARGVVADGSQTQSLSDAINKIAKDEALISPTGRVSAEYPTAGESMRLLQDYAGSPMDPKQMQVVRETLADAAFKTDGKEQRIARKMLREFDDFVSPLAPELAEARKVSQRYLQAGQLEQARELAGVRAGQFTGSGFENALRTEYRGLDRKIAKGQMPGVSDDLAGAIADVSRGTTGSNIARNVGKFAPTGVVSTMGSAGLPFMVGNAFGGPVAGSVAAGLTSGTGLAGRSIATNMGLRNAEIAELLARSGVPIRAGAELTPELMEIAAALLAGTATGQGAQ